MSGLATRIETDLDVYPMKYHMNEASSCNIKLKIMAPQFCALVKMPIWERTKKTDAQEFWKYRQHHFSHQLGLQLSFQDQLLLCLRNSWVRAGLAV